MYLLSKAGMHVYKLSIMLLHKNEQINTTKQHKTNRQTKKTKRTYSKNMLSEIKIGFRKIVFGLKVVMSNFNIDVVFFESYFLLSIVDMSDVIHCIILKL